MLRNSVTALLILLVAPQLLAEIYGDPLTGLAINTPEGWETREARRKHFIAMAPDRDVRLLIVNMRHFKDEAECIQKLDRDDVYGGQIKTIKVAGEPEEMDIKGLKAKRFSGVANISNERMPFVAVVTIPREGIAFVAFAFGSKEGMKEQAETLAKSFNTIRRAQ